MLSHAVMLLISLLALALILHSAHNLPITVLQRLWDQAGVLKICHPMVLQIALHSAKMRTYWFDATAGQGRVALPNHSRAPKGDNSPTQSDAKCYGGRFTYGQWRQFFARQPEKGLRLDASGQVIQESHLRDFSWNTFVQFFRAEIWLLVLLHSDGASMASMACLCQGYQKISLPWQHRGTRSGVSNWFTLVSTDSKALEKSPESTPEPTEKQEIQEMGVTMGVSQLAARRRCGLHLAEELLDSNEISLPRQCYSWLDLLCKQEMQGAGRFPS